MAKTETKTDAVPATADGAAPAGETKRGAFVRVATRRTTNASHAIRQLIALTNKANYDYTPAHWAAIGEQLKGALSDLNDAIAGKQKVPVGFDLSAVEDDAEKKEDAGEEKKSASDE